MATFANQVLSVPRREPNTTEVEIALAEIAQHKTAITSLEEQVSSLLAQLKHHRDEIDSRRTVATFARRIPVELLAMIFENCIDDGWRCAPLVLSQVCTAWHAAASTPRLWSHIHVSGEGRKITPESSTRYWLTKAGNSPLHIAITWHAAYGFQEHMFRVMDMLFRRVAQWRSLVLHMWDEDLNQFLASCSSMIPTNLRYLDTGGERTKRSERAQVRVPLVDAFGEHNTPRLATIKHICSALPSAPIFPPQIRSLDLEVWDERRRTPIVPSDYVPVLLNLSHLRRLTLSTLHVFKESSAREKLILLPRLESLSLDGLFGFELLRYIDVPSLRELSLHAGTDFISQLDDFLALLADCSPPLEMLELHRLKLDPAKMATCFARLEDLRELRVYDSRGDDETLGVLVQHSEFCSRLARLALRQTCVAVRLCCSWLGVVGEGAEEACWLRSGRLS